jgi:hypothetical protein
MDATGLAALVEDLKVTNEDFRAAHEEHLGAQAVYRAAIEGRQYAKARRLDSISKLLSVLNQLKREK